MSANTTPDISVVIVSWNVRDLLAQCLDSFLTVADLSIDAEAGIGVMSSRGVDFWVVDNASADDTVAMLQARFPWVHCLAAGRNLGFSAGNNLALRQCTGHYVLLLNPDTMLTRSTDGRDAISLMADLLDADDSLGVVGPRLVYGDGTPQSSRRRLPTLGTAVMESTLLERWFPHNRWARHYRLEDVPDDVAQNVDWLTGACLLIRRQALDESGLFDEGFFMYSEELDLCQRIAEAGWGIRYTPDATVLHYEGKSSGQVTTQRQLLFDTSKVRYFAKHHGAAAATTLRLYLLSTYALSLTIEALKWLVGHKRPLRARRIRAYRELLTSRLLAPEDTKR